MSASADMKGAWIWRGVASLLLVIVTFFVKANFEEQRTYNVKMDERVKLLELEAAKSSGNRFTSAEWAANKTVIDSNFAAQNLRITRVEDAIAGLEKILMRMEKKIDDLNYEKPK